MKKSLKRLFAGVMSLVILLSSSSLGSEGIFAQQVSGNAPFINTWLVAGPFENAVADQIYSAAGSTDPTESTDPVEPVEPGGEIVKLDPDIVEASTSYDSTPAMAVDGDLNTAWKSDTRQGVVFDPIPTLTLTLPTASYVTEIKLNGYERNGKAFDVVYSLYDKSGALVTTGTVENLKQDTVNVDIEDGFNIKTIVLKINERKDTGNTSPNHLGFREVEIFGVAGEEEVPPEPTANITPVLGEYFGIDGGESQAWEYFDDRLYNRNYDDYQDLMGYYNVKKGVDTKNKYLYAHSYVYSSKEQVAYFCVGASGSYRMYVNDVCVSGSPTTPKVDPQKDMTKVKVTLKEGWNKLLIQIYHDYTEDVNSNGVPLGADASAAYVGFYGRVADSSGNKIEDIVYSVTGDSANLEIVSQSLSASDETAVSLPENNMPTGYKEWPYVWNKSTSSNQYGLSASAFQFMASGGAPGYTWEIIDGELPLGLELSPDGTIADGLVDGKADLSSDKGIISIDCEEGDYTFTVQVTDNGGAKATREFTITVKERPNKWFEEGRVSALTHAPASYSLFADPNYDVDAWAQRAKEQGHSLVSVETLQQLYYWPSKFYDPKYERNIYNPVDADGNFADAIKPFEEAVKRYGMKFGVYYATQITDVLIQDVADLIERYDPAYIYFDGPQGFTSANYDIMYSSIRNYSNDIVINSNAWGEEYGDPDLRTAEADGIYGGSANNHLVKRTPSEPWKMIRGKYTQSIYYGKRDDYRQVAKEMIMNAGRGYVDNNDQTIIDHRGPFWTSASDIASRYSRDVQEFIDIRELMIDWFSPEGKPERHESTTGTNPYYLSGWGYEDDGKGNYDNFAKGKGPDWGYATYRDNNIYLHIMEGPDSKIGFSAISDNTLTISPVSDTVQKVTWFNEDIDIEFTQEGNTLTINLDSVNEDPVDTIIKIVTDNPSRRYVMTDLNLTGNQLSDTSLQIEVEATMTFPALKTEITSLTFTSENPAIAKVSSAGLVTAVADGKTGITVTAENADATVTETLPVTVSNGKVYVGEELIGASMRISSSETYGEFSCFDILDITLYGRGDEGGSIGLVNADVEYHTALVDLSNTDKYNPMSYLPTDILKITDGKLYASPVTETTRVAVWADVTLDGKTFTSNKVFLDLLPYENLAKDAVITASENEENAGDLVDGVLFTGEGADASKWSAASPAGAWVAFEFKKEVDITGLSIHFNTLNQRYLNTPKTMEVQTSEDGEYWETIKSFIPPTGTSYFPTQNIYNQYDFNASTKYLRLYFPNGGNNAVIDLIEVGINGISNPLPRVESPIADPAGGKIDDEVTVTLSCATEGADIYYTLDGSNPSLSTSAIKYEGPITLSDTTFVKAYAKKDEHWNSYVVTYYFATASDLRNPTEQISAESHDDSYGIQDEDGNIGYFSHGDWMRYDYLYFGETLMLYKLKVNLARPSSSGSTENNVVEFYLNGKPDKLGELAVESTGAWATYQIQETVLEVPIMGINSLYVEGVRKAGTSDICNIRWYQFEAISEVTALRDIELETEAGTAPNLPETVVAEFGDEYTALVNVKWDAIPVGKYQAPGTFMVNGTVTGTDKTVTATVTVTKVVSKPEEKIEISARSEGAGTVAINGGSEEAVCTENIQIGETVTLTAHGDTFRYWRTTNGNKIVSTQESFQFIAGTDADYTAVFAEARTVTFYNQNDRLIASINVAEDADAIEFPDMPFSYGYVFKEWSMTESEILEALQQGDVKVEALYDKIAAKYHVEITNGKTSGDYEELTVVTATADQAPAGKKFSYWVSEGSIVNYNPVYKFYLTSPVALEAVYMDEQEPVEESVLIHITNVAANTASKKISFTAERSLPASATLVQHGIIVSNSALDETSFVIGAADVLKGTATTIGMTGTYILNKGSVESGDTWYARGYVTYKTADGKVKTVYSDIAEGTMPE